MIEIASARRNSQAEYDMHFRCMYGVTAVISVLLASVAILLWLYVQTKAQLDVAHIMCQVTVDTD